MTRQLFLYPFLLLTLSPFSSFSQSGGRAIFEFLQLSPSARVTALGGRYISVQDSANADVILAQMNPAILSIHSTKSISLNQSFYFGGTRFSTLSGALHLPKENITVHAGLQYLDYGKFQGADEFGNKTNEFNASDMAFIAGASRKLFDDLSIGLNLKFIFSQLESYNSSGLGMDLGALYTLKQNRQYLGLSVRHMGIQWDPYYETREPLPFNIELGYTQRLEYVPIQFSITAHDLQRWSLRYDNPDAEVSIFGEPVNAPSSIERFIDNAARHLIFGAEVLIGKYAPLRLRVGYHHQRHQELKDQNYRGLSGFSGGVGIKLSRLSFDYGMANYHLAGSMHSIGLTLRWKQI
jgi:hypothetical protein